MKRRFCNSLAIITVFLGYASNMLFAQTVGTAEPIVETSVALVEPHLAINPTDPDNFIATAITVFNEPNNENHIGAYYSTDGGATWSGNDDIGGEAGLGDPVVAFDSDGNGYLLYQKRSAGDLLLRKSTDGGASWQSAVTAVDEAENELDRPWMAVSRVHP